MQSIKNERHTSFRLRLRRLSLAFGLLLRLRPFANSGLDAKTRLPSSRDGGHSVTASEGAFVAARDLFLSVRAIQHVEYTLTHGYVTGW